MPIAIDPTTETVVVPQEQSFTANALWGDMITIDGSSRDLTKVSATVNATPYAADPNGNPTTFAATSKVFKTADLVTAMGRIPQMAAAYAAVEVGIVAWYAYLAARQVELDAATTALTTAQAALVTAQATEQTTAVARTAAYAARTSETDSTWTAADAAWQAAAAAAIAANTAVTSAQKNVMIATAALADPANPPLITT